MRNLILLGGMIGIFLLALFAITNYEENLSPQNSNTITGFVIESGTDTIYDFSPINHPKAHWLQASWSLDTTLSNLGDSDLGYISIIENRRKHIAGFTSNDVEVPLEVVIGVIHTESWGKTYPAAGDLCNSLGYCGLMQVNKEKCIEDPNCDWAEFSAGDVDNQVSPGIRYMGYMAKILVNNGMRANHPHIWYFAAMAYNGGPGRVFCGNSACTSLKGTIIGNIMELKGYSDINQVSFNDVLDSLEFDKVGNIIEKGVFDGITSSISAEGAKQMVSHAIRTMEATYDFLGILGKEIEIPPYQPSTRTTTTSELQSEENKPRVASPPKLPEDALAVYAIIPSFKTKVDYHLDELTALGETAKLLVKNVKQCKQDMVALHGTEPQIIDCVYKYLPDGWSVDDFEAEYFAFSVPSSYEITQIDKDTGELTKEKLVYKFALYIE
ncbi:lytic transglycosylase domain-containing protein [Candidatus Woesearchaeota archaeon]|nr:lytic transglycosylase domain-containing protein [Candidatus Woesearchaeota archaeon]